MVRPPLALALTFALALAAPAPALAQARPAAPAPVEASAPGVLGLTPILLPFAASLGAPLGVFGAAFMLQSPLLVVAAPLGMGAGQALAGDPRRGALVGLGSYGTMAAGFGIGLGLTRFANNWQAHGFDWINGGILALGVGIGYWVWAAFDAGATGARRYADPDPF